ncbi:MAG: oligoendopeptidase F [Spirochaetae bacterium HGW-Spirochaetae-3]|jgi:oligoendopeptidase F|nr:MAG: oligoendopeptidase F [Spirochaetae bacterium HGW-Spirochaetae-3]
MTETHDIPARKDVPAAHRWDLSSLSKDESAWEADLAAYEAMMDGIPAFRGTIAASSDSLYAALSFRKEYSMLDERLGYYAHLRQTEDEGDSGSRGRMARYMMAATKGAGAWSWFTPELQRVPEAAIQAWMAEERYGEYRVFLSRILRYKPHVLSEAEERLLALSADAATTPQEAFSVLTNVDLDFGSVDTPEGSRPLSQSTFSSFMHGSDRRVRRDAYLRFYAEYDAHKNTVAQLYAGQCKLDSYQSTVRNFPSSRARELFADDVPESVYDNLVSTVGANLPVLHEYYALRKKALGLDELRHYDVYVPLVGQVKVSHTWEQAVDAVSAALAPLGEEYVSTLRGGLLGSWADRYENKGKRSGAFSAGSFAGAPYILMNYKDDVIRDVFTMAHEGGHSMHSYYSAKANPFMHYNYTIFEAEVASTFNEALLFDYMTKTAKSTELKTYLLASRVDDILATLFRQTMFAEYEHRAHAMLEAGEPLTVDALRSEYRGLLEKYFGPEMRFESTSDLEGLRIPHFYNSYYVYKYATGISASIALSKKVLSGEKGATGKYYEFLRSGGSRFPIESLKVAGVDMSSPEPVAAACAEFARLCGELKVALGV